MTDETAGGARGNGARLSIAERLKNATVDTLRQMFWTLPGAVLIPLVLSVLGYLLKEEACSFARSASCLVVYQPEFFECELS